VRSFNQAIETAEVYSPAEERFNRRRRTVGLFLAPAVMAAIWAAPLPLAIPAHRMAAIMGLVVVLWVSEALPMAVTALLGPVLAVVLRVADARAAFASFADPIIFLFIGSFILAEAMFVHGVDRRIAYTALSWKFVGHSAPRVLFVYSAVATGISMWISNTATTAMMFPIGLALVSHLMKSGPKDEASRTAVRRFALGLMLMTSFGASVGGMATPVGTPPNLIGIGMLERIAGTRISFFTWMAIGMPLVLVLFAALVTLFTITTARGVKMVEGGADLVRTELQKLGALSPAERNVLLAFGATVLLWTLPGFLALAGLDGSAFSREYQKAVPEGVAAMIGALLLFVLPVDWRARRFTLTWDQAVRIDWGIVLLYGGGLTLGALAFQTGLADALGRGITAWLPSKTSLTLTVMFTGAAILLSEATSNTASANMIVPVAIAVAQAAGVRAVEPALGATLGASMGFMMPISTAPNAIVYSSGFIPITAMMRYGIVLDVVAFVAIVIFVMLLGPVLIP
jgi:solute carrier family 13 (sodium-dependent dicarboxylate transporter), member 2/3/5